MERKLVSRKLKVEKGFTPCPVADDDELFPNGIFEFNITKMLEWIEQNPDDVIVEYIAVSGFFKDSSVLIRLTHTTKTHVFFQAKSGAPARFPASADRRCAGFAENLARKWGFQLGVCDNRISTDSSINESHMDSVDISRPVILAEIAPARYNLIDGHHRMEKARRMEIKSILAYRLSGEQHKRFLTSKRAYLTYVEYWNSKLK